MTAAGGVSCEVFRDEVAELAVGVAAAATSDRLLAHARECAACQTLLDESTVVADHLLHLAPGWEPPAGFEVRALAGMRAGDAVVAPARRRRRGPVLVAAAAALVVVSTLGGLALGRATAPSSSTSADVVSARGSRVGTVEVATVSGRTLLVLTMPEPATWPGTWTCELQSSDGDWVAVGSWRADEVRGGVWATGIEPALASAGRMRVLDGTGRLVATAALA